jgi:hypothetical protein
MTASPRRFPWSTVISAVLLLALFEYLFFVPLRPTAWGGPREAGPFENVAMPAAGWFSREARLHLERFAKQCSPDRALDATAEALAGYHALLAVARYAVLWVVLWRLGGKTWLASLGVVGAALPMVLGGPRQTDADVGLLLFVLLIGATTPKRPPWWVVVLGIPALFALWANAHASVIVGLAWLGVVTFGRAIEWWKVRAAVGTRFQPVRIGTDNLETCPHVGRFLLSIALAIGATCANPDGPRIFVDAFAVAKNPNIAALPAWQPIDFSKPAGMPWAYFTALAAILVVQIMSPRPFSPTALAVVLTFGIWPLVQQRGSDYWWLIVPWLIVPKVAAIRLPGREESATGSADAKSAEERKLPAWPIILVCGFAVVATPAARWLITGQPRSLESIASRDTPVRLALELTAAEEHAGQHLPGLREQVRATYPAGRFRGAILCGEEQGDFLAWVLEGDNNQPVMIYSRPETFDQAHWAECRKALDGEGVWWEILGRHQVNLVVIDPGRSGKLADRLRASAEWATVQDDGPGGLLVAVRREPKLPAELMAP